MDEFGRSISQKAVAANKRYLDKLKQNEIIKEIKKLGIVSEIHISAINIETDLLTFDQKHISERGYNVSLEEAKSYIINAKFSASRWNGQFENFYSENGATFIL